MRPARMQAVPTYTYEAAGKDGALTRGAIEAPSRSVAVERILQQGKTPVRVTEGSSPGSDVIGRVLPRLRTSRARVTLLQEMAVLLRAGLTLERTMLTLIALATAMPVRRALEATLESLRGGEPLSAAMRRAPDLFPETMRRLVAAGEASGRLPDVIARIAAAELRARELSDRVVSALIYPALLVITMLAVLALIFTGVLPQLEPLFREGGAALPWSTAILVWLSHLFRDFGLAMALLLVLALAALLQALRQPAARTALDRHVVHARYLLGIPLDYHAAQFCRNLAMLLDGGLPLNRALELAGQAVANRHIGDKMAPVVALVRQGRSLRASLEDAAVMPRIALEFVAVGEETGRLAPMLDEAARILDRDVQVRLDRLTALLLPVVTIVLGLVVAAIMGGVVSGIFAANDLAIGP